MVELIETVLNKEYLKDTLEFNVIEDWIFDKCYLSKMNNIHRNWDEYNNFRKKLPLMIEDIQSKNNVIYITLFDENEYYYVIIYSCSSTSKKWQKIKDKDCKSYILCNNEKIWFKDPEYNSLFKFTKSEEELNNILNNYSPDILSPFFTYKYWCSLIKDNMNSNITSFLTNDNIISGICDFIKSESLYKSKISPYRSVKSLSNDEISQLYKSLIIIPRVLYNRMNTKNQNFSYENEDEEKYRDIWKSSVYDKSSSKKSTTMDGRITFWKPNIQK